MKADSETIHKVFQYGGYLHYILPHYFQREYAWGKPEWDVLLQDLFSVYQEIEALDARGQDDSIIEHFMGSLVFVEAGVVRGSIVQFTLVDGQQRLTTISLLLCALYRIIANSDASLSDKIHRLLINPHESGDVYFKLLPTTKYGDRFAYQAIIRGQAIPESESRIPLAFDYLYHALKQKIDNDGIDSERLFQVLTSAFQVVRINLSKDESPYKIFESLNAKGKPLAQADLVRNFIAMTLAPAEQEQVFCEHWSPIENLLQEKRGVGRSGIGELTGFLRHYLMMQSGILYNQEHVYARFRDRIKKDFADTHSFINEVRTLHEYAIIYDRILRPEKQSLPELQEAMRRLDVLDLSTAYPFLMATFFALEKGILTVQQVREALRLLENYLIRRFLANEPTNYLNKMFPLLWHQVDKTDFVESLREQLAKRNYPSDTRIGQILLTRPLYRGNAATRKQIVFLLEQVNRHLSVGTGGYTVLNESPTIEHILPQTLTDEWEKELGSSKARVGEFVHTLGNLTLVTSEWNSSLSNSAFAMKKAKLCNHALKLNSTYFQQNINHWNENIIAERTQYLVDRILEIWASLKNDADEEPQEVTSADAFRPRLIQRMSAYFNVPLLKRTDRQYASADDTLRIVIAVSRLYMTSAYQRYWFAFKEQDTTFLDASERGFLVLGCGSEQKVCLIPFDVLATLLPSMGATTNDTSSYRHVVIFERGNRFLIGLPGLENSRDVTEFFLIISQ